MYRSTYSERLDRLTIWFRDMPRDEWRRRIRAVDVFPGVKLYYREWPAKPPKGLKYLPGHPRPKTMDLLAIRIRPYCDLVPDIKEHASDLQDPGSTLVLLRKTIWAFAYDAQQADKTPSDMRELGRREGRVEVCRKVMDLMQTPEQRKARAEAPGRPDDFYDLPLELIEFIDPKRRRSKASSFPKLAT